MSAITAVFIESAQHVLDVFNIEIVAFDTVLLQSAQHAFKTYGKGRHKASLNFGDCMSYVLAKTRGLSLLYKGEDFVHTNIRSALP